MVIDVECQFIGVLRMVQKNPGTMYDDSKVINLDWIESCEESILEEMEVEHDKLGLSCAKLRPA